MEITNVKIYKAKQRGPVLAYANVILDKQFMIRGITLIEKDGRKFISMPSRRVLNGDRNFRDTAHPLQFQHHEIGTPARTQYRRRMRYLVVDGAHRLRRQSYLPRRVARRIQDLRSDRQRRTLVLQKHRQGRRIPIPHLRPERVSAREIGLLSVGQRLRLRKIRFRV